MEIIGLKKYDKLKNVSSHHKNIFLGDIVTGMISHTNLELVLVFNGDMSSEGRSKKLEKLPRPVLGIIATNMVF